MKIKIESKTIRIHGFSFFFPSGRGEPSQCKLCLQRNREAYFYPEEWKNHLRSAHPSNLLLHPPDQNNY